MKSVGYVAAVVRLYRLALDWLAARMQEGLAVDSLSLPDVFRQEMEKIGTRGQSETFSPESLHLRTCFMIQCEWSRNTCLRP